MRKLLPVAILLCALSAHAERRLLEPRIFDQNGPTYTWKQSLAAAGETFLAAWVVDTRSGYEVKRAVHYAALDSNGARISPIRIEEGDLFGTTIATNGNEFVFLRALGAQVIATRVDRNGVKIADVVLSSDGPYGSSHQEFRTAAVVWTGKG